MPKPLILSVDDDPTVLKVIERDLRNRYSEEYHIVSINSGPSAFEHANKVHQKNDQIALFLVDQRMPQMTGVEFLAEARRSIPPPNVSS